MKFGDECALFTDELKDAKHERNLSDGLAHSLQRDVVRGQHTISKLTTALEKAQKETQEAVAKAKAMSNKFSNLKEEIKHEEILATMEKNFCDVRKRYFFLSETFLNVVDLRQRQESFKYNNTSSKPAFL